MTGQRLLTAMAQADDRHTVPFILLAQTLVSLGLAALLWLFQDIETASAGLMGGMTAVIPNAFLAARLLGPSASKDAKALLRAAWVGEIGKLLLTVLLFAVIFLVIEPSSALAVFGGFIAAQSMVLGALLVGSGASRNFAKSKS